MKTTGNSPLAPGQWQGFLAVYAGLWAMQNFIRPIRFTIALGECAGKQPTSGWLTVDIQAGTTLLGMS